jgi:diaminohydroxyphosphoribosylaminopyrimidine deaminase/5-amino-6-(5-phosphoribosylamino)uracil reductase
VRKRWAGIEVEVGLYEEQAKLLNAPFYKHSRTGVPWVIVKWAQSIDGKLAWKHPPAEGNWISNEESRADVHRLRKRTQAILTGVDTVIADNPHLTVRIPETPITRPPVRVVIDSQLRTPWDCHLITVHDAPTMLSLSLKKTATAT